MSTQPSGQHIFSFLFFPSLLEMLLVLLGNSQARAILFPVFTCCFPSTGVLFPQETVWSLCAPSSAPHIQQLEEWKEWNLEVRPLPLALKRLSQVAT